MLNQIATLNTSHTYVEISEVTWTGANEVSHFTLPRPAVTLVLLGSEDVVEAGYCDRDATKFGTVGRVVFTPSNREILGRSRTPGKARLVQCSFDRAYAERIAGPLTDLSRSQLYSCLSIRSTLLPSLLSRLMTEAMHPGFVSNALTESLGQTILLECSHVVLANEHHRERGKLTARHLRIIDDYLAALKYGAPSVSAIAQACNLSERYFAKLFRERTQQSIGQYLKSVQITKAVAYLLETDLPLKEIAFRLGFSATSNFSAAFRAATGDTPGRFRSANRVYARKHSDDPQSITRQSVSINRSA